MIFKGTFFGNSPSKRSVSNNFDSYKRNPIMINV